MTIQRRFAHSLLTLTMLLGLFALTPAVRAQTTPYVPRILSGSFSTAVAVDGSGNVFYIGNNSSTLTTTYQADGIYELVAVGGVIPSNATVRKLAAVGATILSPLGIAVDGLGNVYVSDAGANRAGTNLIEELVAVNGSVPDNPTIRTVISGLDFDGGTIAVDGHGNLFFVNVIGSSTDSFEFVDELAAVNGSIPDNPTAIPLLSQECNASAGCVAGLDIHTPAADGNGDLFLLDGSSVIELPAVNGSIQPGETPVSVLSGAAVPGGDVDYFTVNPSGSLFAYTISESSDGTISSNVLEVAEVNGVIPVNAAPVTLYTTTRALLTPNGIAADNNGNVFAANGFSGQVQNILELSPGSGSPPAAQASLTPASSNFGTVTTGASSAAATFTLANAGTAALSISSVSLGGANASSFVLGANTCGASLAAGASCTIAVSFTPQTAGNASAALNVVDAVGTQTAALTGNGASPAAPLAALTPATADFGSVTVGTSSAGSAFTLANAGNATLPVTSVSLGGTNTANFSITANTCGSSLPAGASCTITVTFTPSATGNDSATLSVVDSVGTQTSTLTGTGVTAVPAADFDITASPDHQTVPAGSSAVYSVDVDSSTGTFLQPVELTASGLPPGSTVSFAPATVTPGASGATATMTISTAAPSAANHLQWLGRTGGAPLLAVLLCLPVFLCKRSLLCFAWFAVILVAGGLQGCGGGFALPESPANTQTYTVTVTGTAGTVRHSTTVQLSIQSE
jgi:hypothetical protein